MPPFHNTINDDDIERRRNLAQQRSIIHRENELLEDAEERKKSRL